ncbi:DUF6056 family protein [Clostridium vincentii]|uniref:Uncharacterized protein n=1 Tax=Clostridium vincentii TaxID=52704 RepID=A0A2T0BGR5_9CLOT|nr:DUF6056 family protein [Clostridium vincentii]PRR83064.1 hypothetical protein CLVI_13130 [Clostridium vincentii]
MKSIRNIFKNPTLYLYIIIFTIIFLLTNNMHFNADEYNYSHITWTNTRISSLSDILTSQKILYFNWTGRIIVHSLIQLFLFIGGNTFPIVNSFVFCIFIYLISNLVFSKKTPYLLLIIFAIVWIFTPMFGETIVWLSGSINYLWPSTLFLLLLNIYSKNNSKTPLLMIIAFITGASHEMIFICGGAYLLLDLCISKFNHKKILTFLCFLIGGLFLILAPGNFLRVSQPSNILRTSTIIKVLIGIILFAVIVLINTKLKSTFIKYIDIIKKHKKTNTILSILCILSFICLLILILTNYIPTSGILLAIYYFKFLLILIPLFIFLFLKCIKQNMSTEQLLVNLNLFFIGIISGLAMYTMPECPDRSFFLSCTIINIAIINLIGYLGFKKSYLLTSSIFILAFITLSLTIHYYIIFLGSWKKDFNTQITASEGSSQIVLPIQPKPLLLISNYYGAAPSTLSNTPNSITNYYTANYYNFEEIIGVEQNTIVMKIEKDNIDKNAIYFEYIDSDGTTKKSYSEKVQTEPSKSDSDKNQAFISIPSDSTDIQFINKSSLEITNDNITIFKLK